MKSILNGIFLAQEKDKTRRGGEGNMQEFRCETCRKLLGKYADCRYLEIKCPRCNTINVLPYIRQSIPMTQTKKA